MPATHNPDRLSATFAALADPTRRAILARLASGEASVSELAEPFAISPPAVTKHLKMLERAGLISRSREAQRRPCKLEAQPLQDSSVRVHDAQNALQGLALETGGKAFVNGVTPKRMIQGIKEDLGCVWLLSFDPEGLPQDEPLPVLVEVNVPKVKVRVRGQTVIQSASKRLTNRLLANFAVETEDRISPLRAGFVPLAWKDGKPTYWIDRAETENTLERYSKQF